MKRFEGKAVVVTGATGGIGRASAQRLADEGARIGVADLDLHAATTVAESVGGFPLVMDVASVRSVESGFEEFVGFAGRLDGVVNCAGIVDSRPLDQIEPDAWSRMFDVNVRGTHLCCNAAIRHMGSGASIVNIGSRAGLVGGTTSGASYAASKAAVICYTKSLAKFVAKRGIRANVINPGCIETVMLESFAPEVQADMPRQAALGRLGQPDEIASTVAFLLSDDSSYMTGAQLNVNGGSHM
jgi:NAD(P)-dependent dehydrogenase (short-subunit alcohol dehydrogenase family)